MIHAADLFCGAGGASTGLLRAADALGVPVKLLAVNHWPVAVETHALNHPGVRHLCESIERINPRDQVPAGRLNVLLAGPECTHHSSARGGRPINDQSRASAWHILKWAQELYIDTILIENVPEFQTWGPLGANGRPLKSRKGQTYEAFLGALRSLGYRVETRILNAADFGDPTTRKRLFILAQRGPKRVAFPEPTHSAVAGKSLLRQTARWRAAREIIDWSTPSRSIFGRKKPLAPATMARILAGLEKFGGSELRPFLIILRQHMGARSLDKPLPTLSARGQHVGICEPFLVPFYGERPGQDPRTHSVDAPIPTLPASPKFGVVESFVLQQQSGGVPRSTNAPLPTVATDGAIALVEPFITKYNGTARNRAYSVDDPLDTVSTKDRFGLVQPVVDGLALDVRFRMLQPHELAGAMSFPKSYVFTGKREEIVRQIGNAWPGETARALCHEILTPYAARLNGRKARVA